MLNVSFRSQDLNANDAIIVLVNDQLKIINNNGIDEPQYHGILREAIENPMKFNGNFGQAVSITVGDKNGKVKQLIIIGLGEESKISEYQFEEIGGKIHNLATIARAASVGVAIDSDIGGSSPEKIASLMASGALLASYRFDKYHTKKTDEEKFITPEFNIIIQNESAAEELFEEKKAVATAVFFARDCVSEVPNVLYPESYAERIVDALEPLGIDVQVIGEREMHNLGMGALLGVGQGSTNESKLVVMKYEGGKSDQNPVCFVGKGVTFDTGGISLKPANGMEDMKYDMGGSASVVGAMKALASRSAKVNAVGIVGLVENMPGGNAQRPGDVVTTMSGITAEVLNTDAEGRLVLCDCVWYLQENFKPDCIIDLATLTGAIVVSLGHTYAGLFANDDELAQKLTSSSLKTNEKLWRMPLHKDYDAMIKSSVADVANIGSLKGAAGSATAAHFIGRFIKDGVKWAHLDIAGTAWDKQGGNPICPKGAVGFGVRLLNQFVKDHYE
jgi:leucyl aminopeptidase